MIIGQYEIEIKVPIQEELKKGLIFGQKARPPIGIILGFVDYSHEVMPLMQTLSQATRAYIVNAGGLSGFLVKYDIMKHLKAAEQVGQLEHAKKWQVIHLRVLKS